MFIYESWSSSLNAVKTNAKYNLYLTDGLEEV